MSVRRDQPSVSLTRAVDSGDEKLDPTEILDTGARRTRGVKVDYTCVLAPRLCGHQATCADRR